MALLDLQGLRPPDSLGGGANSTHSMLTCFPAVSLMSIAVCG